MDVRFINPFIVAIQRVFQTMLRTQVTVRTPTLATDSRAAGDVSGIIGLSGDVSGAVVLSFPMAVAASVASAFAGSPIDEHSPDFADAIGELTNMVAGNAKTQFAGLHVGISLPSVIMGRDHTVSQSRANPRILIPCETTFGPVFVDVCIVMTKSQAKPETVSAGAAR